MVFIYKNSTSLDYRDVCFSNRGTYSKPANPPSEWHGQQLLVPHSQEFCFFEVVYAELCESTSLFWFVFFLLSSDDAARVEHRICIQPVCFTTRETLGRLFGEEPYITSNQMSMKRTFDSHRRKRLVASG